MLARLSTGKAVEAQSEARHGSLVAVSATFPQHKWPRTRQAPAAGARPPGTVTLWGLAQPSAALGVTSALTISEGADAEPSLTQDGFLDVSRRTGLEWSLASGPACRLSGDLELSGT